MSVALPAGALPALHGLSLYHVKSVNATLAALRELGLLPSAPIPPNRTAGLGGVTSSLSSSSPASAVAAAAAAATTAGASAQSHSSSSDGRGGRGTRTVGNTNGSGGDDTMLPAPLVDEYTALGRRMLEARAHAEEVASALKQVFIDTSTTHSNTTNQHTYI